MLNRLVIPGLSLLLALSSYACGDDDSDDDGSTIDGGDGGDDDGGDDGEADAGADASAGPREPELADREGGQIVFEYITLDDDLLAQLRQNPDFPKDATTILRVMSHFVRSQEPEANALPPVGDCVNLYESHGWPLGYLDLGGQKREYVDVGSLSLTGKNAAKKDVTIDIPVSKNPVDNWSRGHEHFYEFIPPFAENFVLPDSQFTVEMGGSDEYPAATYENLAYMPGDFEITNPGLNDDDIGLSTTADATVEWEVVDHPNLPEGVLLLTVVVLADPNTGSPVLFCPTLTSAGQFPITGEHIQSYRQAVEARAGKKGTAEQAILLRNHVAHTLGWFRNGDGELQYDPDDPRRIDMLSLQCKAQIVNTPE